MYWKNSINHWGFISWLFHWALAALIIWMFVQGNNMEAMEMGTEKYAAISLHKSMGLLILLLVLARLAWRSSHPRPTLSIAVPMWKRWAARINHGLLYLLMIVQPVSGIVMSTAAAYPPSFFGLWKLPQFFAANESIAESAGAVHAIAWCLLALLISIHFLAAAHHYFRMRDQILQSMLLPASSDS